MEVQQIGEIAKDFGEAEIIEEDDGKYLLLSEDKQEFKFVGSIIISQVLSGSVSIFGCEVDKTSTLLPIRVESDGSKAMVLSVKNNSAT